MGMQIRGMNETLRGFKKLAVEMEEAAGETVDAGIDILYKESQIEVPKESGTLANSARKVTHSDSGPQRSAGVKYGEGAEDSNGESYAAAVHEILKASHALPTKAKYVEDPLVQNVGDYAIAATVASKKAVERSF